MRQGTLVVALLCLGLLVVPAVGGTVADSSTTAAGGSDTAAPESKTVEIADGIQTADGETEVFVRLDDAGAPSDENVTVAALRRWTNESQAPLRAFAGNHSAVTIEHAFWLTNAALVRVNTSLLPVKQLETVPGVVSLGENPKIEVLDAADTRASSASPATRAGPATLSSETATASATAETTYGLAQIGAAEAWDIYDTQGANTSVAVLDTGVDPDHPDIDLTKWAEFDSNGNKVETGVENATDFDDEGHGTHVSGTVAGGSAGGVHIGVAPDTDLYHGAVLTDCSGPCSGTLSQIIAGMEWGVENDADVLSMSLGANGYYDDFIDPVQNAHAAGTTVVAAVGNDGEGNSSSPGNVYEAISVGASNDTEGIASFSSGEQIDTSEAWSSPLKTATWPDQYVVPSVAAPGVRVNSTLPNGDYGFKSGTSMATPHVAGAVALVQSATDERHSPSEIETALEATADKPAGAPAPEGERDTRYGSGIVDLPEAIARLDAPTAAFTFEPASPSIDENVTLDGNQSVGNVTSYEWDFDADGQTDATGERVNATFAQAGPHDVSLTVTNESGTNDTATEVVGVAPPPVVNDSTPHDGDGDGLFEDVRGDDSFDVFDVQTLFSNLDASAVQDHARAYNFQGSDAEEVTIFDVQALFTDL